MTPRIPFQLDRLAVNDAGHLNSQRDTVAAVGAEQVDRHGPFEDLTSRHARQFTGR